MVIRYLARLSSYSDFANDLNLFPRNLGDLLYTDYDPTNNVDKILDGFSSSANTE